MGVGWYHHLVFSLSLQHDDVTAARDAPLPQSLYYGLQGSWWMLEGYTGVGLCCDVLAVGITVNKKGCLGYGITKPELDPE